MLSVAGAPAAGCSALLACWFIVFIAWFIVLILWLRALMAYGKAYREYEQTYGKPYQSPLEANKLTSVSLKCSRRLYLMLANYNKLLRLRFQTLARNLRNLAQVGVQNSQIINQRANPRRLNVYNLGALLHAYQAAKNLLSQFLFGSHKSNVRKQANVQSSGARDQNA